MSNLKILTENKANLSIQAIRGHWAVEVNNHIRDVILNEDKLITKSKDVARPMSLFRPLVLSLLQKENINNYAEKMDAFVDDFNLVLIFLKTVKVL